MDRLSSFERCWSWSSLSRLLMALWRSLLRIDKVSLLETFGSTKTRNFRYTPSCMQLLRKLISNFSLFFFYPSFSYFRKSLTVCIRNSLSLNWGTFLIKMLYLFVKDSFVMRSTSVIKNSNIIRKNLVCLWTFYLLSFLLLTSTSLQNL